MNSGRLRHVITIQTPTKTVNSAGDTVLSWASLTGGANIRASVDQIGGLERYQSEHNKAIADFKVIIRHLSTVTRQMRIAWGSRTLNIVSVDADRTDGRYMIIKAKETDL